MPIYIKILSPFFGRGMGGGSLTTKLGFARFPFESNTLGDAFAEKISTETNMRVKLG